MSDTAGSGTEADGPDSAPFDPSRYGAAPAPTAWGILRDTGRVLRGHWPKLLAVAVTCYSPVLLLLLVALSAVGGDVSALDLEQLEKALDSGCFVYFVQAGLALGVFRLMEGGEALSYRRGMAAVGRNFFELIAVILMTVFAIFAGLILLIVPGVILYCGLFVITPALVVEDLNPFSAWRRSMDLTRGHRWMVLRLAIALLAIVLLSVVILVLPALFVPLAYEGLVDLLLLVLGNVLGTVIMGTAASVTYHRLRQVEGNLDEGGLVEVFE